MENHWILDWLSKLESEETRRGYLRAIGIFSEYCQSQGAQFDTVVKDYRDAELDEDRKAVKKFLFKWQDLIRGYTTCIKTRYVSRTGTALAPLTQGHFLTVVKSFFHFYKIPVDVDLPRRACVQFHNQDFSKEQLRMILAKASPRDRAIFLVMVESGLRASTVINLKYWQIQEDLDNDRVPLRILTPASTIKDHVGDRWSFVGEDGAQELRKYLKPRLPLRAEDYVFAPEKPSFLKGEQFSQASISRALENILSRLPQPRQPKRNQRCTLEVRPFLNAFKE